jgi:heptose II phosphotransferase
LRTFRGGGYEQKLIYANCGLGRYIYLIETAGHKFAIKHIERDKERFEKICCQKLVGCSCYPRIFRLIAEAVDKGCVAAQDIFLVAERKISFTVKEIFIIAEYVEGRPLGRDYAQQEYRRPIVDLLRQLHRCGLAVCDFQPWNIIVTPENKLKAIDISINSLISICQAKDILQFYKYFNFIPADELNFSIKLKSLFWFIFYRDKIRCFVRKIKGEIIAFLSSPIERS